MQIDRTHCASVVSFVKMELDSLDEMKRVADAGSLWRPDVHLPVVGVTLASHVRSQDGHVTQLEIHLHVLRATNIIMSVNQL